MVLILIMLFIAAANVAGCVLIRKRGIQIFLGITAWAWVLIALASGLLLYNISYKTTDIDVSESPDGTHELHFQQIGEPDWPFGSTHARLALENNGKTVATCSFDIANDGKNLGPENWEATWTNNHASATIFGEEQNDYRYSISLDGKIEELQLGTYNGKTIPDTQNEAPRLDKERLPYCSGLPSLQTGNSSGCQPPWPRRIQNGIRDYGKGLSLRRNIQGNRRNNWPSCRTAHYPERTTRPIIEPGIRSAKAPLRADGTESASVEVVDFYLVDCTTLEVTDEHTTQWH